MNYAKIDIFINKYLKLNMRPVNRAAGLKAFPLRKSYVDRSQSAKQFNIYKLTSEPLNTIYSPNFHLQKDLLRAT